MRNKIVIICFIVACVSGAAVAQVPSNGSTALKWRVRNIWPHSENSLPGLPMKSAIRLQGMPLLRRS